MSAQPDAWQARDLKHGGAWTHVPYPRGNPDFEYRALYATPPSPDREAVLKEIAAERQRQISVEGWTAEHDDSHKDGSLAKAAGVYALHSARAIVDVSKRPSKKDQMIVPATAFWPWDFKWWKPGKPRANLIKAGALIVAEIERLDRALAPAPPSNAGEGGK